MRRVVGALATDPRPPGRLRNEPLLTRARRHLMARRLRVLLVSKGDKELSALRVAASRIVGADAVMLALDADSSASDPNLAWGMKGLELREFDIDGKFVGPGVEQPLGPDGDMWKAIVDAAHRNNVDLVTIASHRQGWLRRLLKGSAAHDVLEHADVPVLAVPESALPHSG